MRLAFILHPGHGRHARGHSRQRLHARAGGHGAAEQIHPEHALGLSYDGTTRNFPNAEVVVTQLDRQFWADPAMESRVSQGQRFIEAGRRAIQPYTGRIRTVEMREGLEVIPGLFMLPARGQTPSHVSFRLTSQNQTMLIWDDIAHQLVIQLALPLVAGAWMIVPLIKGTPLFANGNTTAMLRSVGIYSVWAFGLALFWRGLPVLFRKG